MSDIIPPKLLLTVLYNFFQINPVIDKVYKFEEIPEAYEKVSQGHARGKTVIDYTLCDVESGKENKEQQQNV